MMTATECPSIERLRELTLGRLAEDDSDAVLDHLRDCQVCQAELETIGDGDDSLIHAIRSPDDDSGLASEPQFQQALVAALGALGSRDPSLTSSDVPAFPVSMDEYEIVRPLGRGGMGNVYLARHTKLGRLVAIKVLANHRLADAKMKERFEAEMRAVGRLSHPGIVTAHDAREIDGTAVLVTEFIDGMDLSQLVSRTGPIGVANACELVRQVAVALQYTSDQGFVHRDIKPSNIMLGSGAEVKLLDLGLARLQEPVHEPSNLTGTGQAMGTADFIAPEQVTDSRSVDVRADIYSLGCTLFKLLTGHAPFTGPEHSTAFAKMTAHVSSPPPKTSDQLPDVPRGLSNLIASMLAKDPASRPQTPMQVAEKLTPFARDADLNALIHHAETVVPDHAVATESVQQAPPQTQPWLRRTVPRSVAIAAGFVGLFVGLCGGFLIRIKSPDGSVVTVSAPEGSEISIHPEETKESVPTSAVATSLGNEYEAPFLMFAILASKAETDQYVAKHGGPSDDLNISHDGIRWYVVDPDVTTVQNFEKDGQAFHLVREAESLKFTNGNLREEIETAQSKGRQLIELRLSEQSGKSLRELTRNNLKRQLAIIVNGKIRMAPTINDEVGRDVAISGKFSDAEIKFLMDSLGSGLVQPLSKPADATESKTDLQRLQGVWLMSENNHSLVAFDTSTFVIADRDSVLSAGKMTFKGGKHKQMELNYSFPSGPKQTAVYRFLAKDRIELQLSYDPSALLSTNPDDALSVNVVVIDRLGDMPSTMEQTFELTKSPPLANIEVDTRGKLLQAAMQIMQVKSMGIEGYAAFHKKAQTAQHQTESNNHLKRLALGFHNFNAVYRKFPASASTGREGSLGVDNESQIQPFSWRVAILPFIEQQQLYEQYRFDEPWDSEANLKLLDQMPDVYRSPTAPADQPAGHTNYQGIANGTGAMGTTDGLKLRDIRDGTSNTLLIMETESSIPWTKPQDLDGIPEFTNDAVLRYALADGSVQTMHPIDMDKLKSLITRDGGEILPP
ncbi:protein kinase domain-containing protein [Rubripirellula reticaptiva]|uniref:Serine/threonine-protein kinase PknF n=1 Tax=Rubripirellula reticaptiva TaxID=2528013 RepID=A0A5C6F845_9BACT|nr:protein kinase [Rubripirellula reticaptiva]TWU56276.1 Serine/threonine-protein kinase PknF [Rubripirellula reticaptiva]